MEDTCVSIREVVQCMSWPSDRVEVRRTDRDMSSSRRLVIDRVPFAADRRPAAGRPPARPASSWLQLCPPGLPAGAYTVDQVLPIMTNRTPRVGFRRRGVRLSVRQSVAE